MAARPYTAKMSEVVGHLADTPDAADHPLFRATESAEKVAIIAITADRGLAGGYNANVIRATEHRIRDHRAAGRDVQLVVRAGRVTATSATATNPSWRRSPGCPSDRPTTTPAGWWPAVMAPFEAGELDQIELVYTRFVSFGSQAVNGAATDPAVGRPAASGRRSRPGDRAAGGGVPGHKTDYEFEPEPSRNPRPPSAPVVGVRDPGRHARRGRVGARRPPAGHEGRHR